MGTYINSGHLTLVLGQAMPIDEHCLQNGGICYRNVNFRLTRSLGIYWYIFSFD